MDLRLKFPPVPERARDLADVAVTAAHDISGLSLDYSPESLEEIDALIESFAAQTSPESVASTLFCFGCYVGEVLIRHLKGEWVLTAASPMKNYAQWPLVTKMQDEHYWNPIGKVFKRFEEGESESVRYLFSVARGAV